MSKDATFTYPSASRKWRMSIIGLIGLVFIYISSLTTLIVAPSTSVYITPLAQVITVAWSGVIATFVGIQGYVDSRQPQPYPQPQPFPQPVPVPQPIPPQPIPPQPQPIVRARRK